jgi:nitrite reductase/ring-hydroxylating ferredoxin subunit
MGLLIDAGIDEIERPGALGVLSRPWTWRRMKNWRVKGVSGGIGCKPAESGNDPTKNQSAGQRGVDAGPAGRLLAEGRALAQVDGVDVLVVRTRRGIFAVENQCPHTGRHLADAVVSGAKLTCMGHQRRYDLATGRAATRGTRIQVFDASIVGDRLWLAPRFRVGSEQSDAEARVPSAPPHSQESH